MIDEKFDAIVVGAGPAGNACALTIFFHKIFDWHLGKN